MTLPKPTERDIEAAKAYLRERLQAEKSMSRNLESLMSEAAKRIVAIYYSYGLSPIVVKYGNLPTNARMEIDDVIAWLKDKIIDCYETLAIAEHEDNRDDILPIIFGENYGRTFDERLSQYLTNFSREMEVLILAGLTLGIAQNMLQRSIVANMRHPYDNNLIKDEIEEPVSYGRGKTNSMLTAIDNLTKFGIAKGWMENWFDIADENGAVGYVVMRGSSYPCDLCDSMVGFHKDADELPPYHNNCCCIAVPIYADDLSI